MLSTINTWTLLRDELPPVNKMLYVVFSDGSQLSCIVKSISKETGIIMSEYHAMNNYPHHDDAAIIMWKAYDEIDPNQFAPDQWFQYKLFWPPCIDGVKTKELWASGFIAHYICLPSGMSRIINKEEYEEHRLTCKNDIIIAWAFDK